MKRESGYYWVKFLNWEIARWNDDTKQWIILDSFSPWQDRDFTEIDETKIERK